MQIAAALSAAHEAGITHRDIKPENVMARRDGIVKVLDFGLAKLTEPAAPPIDTGATTLQRVTGTESGVVIGTPRYMSPEQARGEKLDARTDIFSLGVLLYEMVAGRAPFAGTTPSEVIAAILRDAPPPLAEYAPDAPQEFEQIVGKALRKDRTERYQTSSELGADLKELKQRIELGMRYGGVLNATRKRLAIFTATALIIVTLVGLVMRTYFNPRPALTEKDTILLADFENKTGEEIFDGMLKQALAIQLQQSPFLHLFPEPQVRHELTLMKRPPNERVTTELAREICERQNLKALIAGSIAPLGSHYVITLEALNGQSGETLAREQVEAENKEQLLRALSQAATRLQERLGESLSSIQRFDRPLQEEGRTAKPEAFKAYSQAIELAISGRLREAIPFYQRAVDIDPDFAYVYSQLAIAYWATSRPELAAECAKKSYALKDQATGAEKFRIIQWYEALVTGNLTRRIETLTLSRRTYPQVATGAENDLAVTYNLLGRSDEAIAEAREAIRLNPTFAAPHRNLVQALIRLNRFAEAKEVLTQALQQNLEMTDFHSHLHQLAFINGERVGMQQQIDWAIGKPDEYAAFDWQTSAAAFAGQWRRAQELSRRAIDLTARGDTKEIAARYATEQALRGAVFEGCRQARVDAAQGLKLTRGRASLPRAALALALCGGANQASPIIDDLTKRYPEDTVINSIWLPAIRAALELRRGNSSQVIEQLQTTSRYETAAEFWPQYLRGQAYLKLGRGSEAAAEFQKILDNRGYAPLSPLYPLAHLGLARAATLANDTTKSRKAWEDFFAAWKEADADLPILREARREHERLR